MIRPTVSPTRSVPLAVAKADARALEQATRAHRLECVRCTTRDGRLMACEDLRQMRAELRERRAEIRGWFDPSPDQGDVAVSPGRGRGKPRHGSPPPHAGEPTAAAAGPTRRGRAAPTDEALERAMRHCLKLVAFVADGPAGSPAMARALERNRDELARALVVYAKAGCR